MKISLALAAALTVSLSTVAVAADAPSIANEASAAAPTAVVIKDRALVKTVDGRKVGYIDRVIKGASGQPTAVQIIYNGRFVAIPASTLTASEKGLVTSLSAKDVNRL